MLERLRGSGGPVDEKTLLASLSPTLPLQCSPMATEIPQRALRNETGKLLRRVEHGERLRITVHGHPVADLVPIEAPQRRTFVPVAELRREMAGLLDPDDPLAEELKALRVEEERDPPRALPE